MDETFQDPRAVTFPSDEAARHKVIWVLWNDNLVARRTKIGNKWMAVVRTTCRFTESSILLSGYRLFG